MSDNQWTAYLDSDYTAPTLPFTADVFIDEGLPFLDMCLKWRIPAISAEVIIPVISKSVTVKVS